MNSQTMSTLPRGERAAAPGNGSGCEPSGQSGAMLRTVSGSASMTPSHRW